MTTLTIEQQNTIENMIFNYLVDNIKVERRHDSNTVNISLRSPDGNFSSTLCSFSVDDVIEE